ncbi:pyrimidine reductase family protein [Subtercola endophyticus]|uniref:pyrimidine reductase family protein n=1 Tax=Subtercola endophyticus TaxID=2895559 RepID=UPI001E4A1FF1|nr:pyrimidine reductase family protein [Subtercola endophyticus]UFS60261.1 pyrimidine reductase family protein [Subtercola endophyticus]
MTESRITQLYPARTVDLSRQSEAPDARSDPAALTDDDLLALYAAEKRWQPRVSANFISSVDGSASAAGLSGDLGGPADKRVFDLQRWVCDAVLVGAGTVRAEGYGAMRVSSAATAWRLTHGFAEHPTFAIVSGRLDLDPASDVFAAAPVRPIVLTTAAADPVKRAHLEAVAEVITCGENTVEPRQLVAALTERGLVQVHCEGGPSLLGSLVAADLLDELCLTVSPLLEGGSGPRIVTAPGEAIDLQQLRLDHVLLAGSMLLTKYSRTR